MQYHELNVREPYFTLIKNGTKTIEGRLYDGKFKDFNIGDKIKFINGDNFCICEIVGLRTYKNFHELLKRETLKKTLPGVRYSLQGVAIYNNFYKEKLDKGIKALAIELKIQ